MPRTICRNRKRCRTLFVEIENEAVCYVGEIENEAEDYGAEIENEPPRTMVLQLENDAAHFGAELENEDASSVVEMQKEAAHILSYSSRTRELVFKFTREE